MDFRQFDEVVRGARAAASRRRVVTALGGMAAASLVGVRDGAAKKKAKKKPLCLNGQTVNASSKQRKKLIKQGATPGACTACSPQCNGASCGGSDGCGGICGCNAGAVCNAGTCTACTVTCTGTPIACGAALTQALGDGGSIVVCPGLYAGRFVVVEDSTLVGAGADLDPATSTIIDAQGQGRPLSVANGTHFSVSGVRVVGGVVTNDGGGMQCNGNGDVRVSNCVFAGNSTHGDGGAIASFGTLSVSNTFFSDNTAGDDGGAIYLNGDDPNFIANCVFDGNTAGDSAGALFLNNADTTVTGTTIQDNRATNEGGGIFLTACTLTLDSATSITGNKGSTGGGIARSTVNGGTLNQNGAEISGNDPNQCANLSCT